MSTDLEQRLHDELRVRAGAVGPARSSGGTVRQLATARRARRLRAGAVAGSAVLAAAVVVGVVTVARDGRPEELPPAVRAGPASPARTRSSSCSRCSRSVVIGPPRRAGCVEHATPSPAGS